ncbi:MAG: hypothetical protein IJH91_08260 [Mogibacterium sp.]|nr:hypothetical protein [Mogibacterium sp.]
MDTNHQYNNPARRVIVLAAEEALNGCTKRVTVGNTSYPVAIPAGVRIGDEIPVYSHDEHLLCIVTIGDIAGEGSGSMATANTSAKPRAKSKGLMIAGIAVCVLALIIGIVKIAGLGSSDDNTPGDDSQNAADDTSSDDISDDSSSDGSQSDSSGRAEEEAFFREYLKKIIANADSYDNGYPVFQEDSDTTRTWKYYALEDFDGDGEIEMLVYREDVPGIGMLCIFERHGTAVTEGRMNFTLGFPGDAGQTLTFYQNAIMIATDESNGTVTQRIFLLDDRYEDLFGIREGRTISYTDDGSGVVQRGVIDGFGIDVIDISREDYEMETRPLYRDDAFPNGYPQIVPEIKDIKDGQV